LNPSHKNISSLPPMAKSMTSRAAMGALMAGVSAMMVACGGGGGTTQGTMNDTVSISSKSLSAGQSTPISAVATMRGTTPKTMIWTVTALSAASQSGADITIADSKCESGSFTAPAFTDSDGLATCKTVLNVPKDVKPGTWRITNTASNGTTSISDYIDIEVSSGSSEVLPSNFKLVESSLPTTGYVNNPIALSIPFTVDPGATVTDVSYKWTPASGNPSTGAIIGSSNSSATFIPTLPGQHQFNVVVTAKVNGSLVTSSATVVASIFASATGDQLDPGLSKLLASDVVATLTGKILNIDASFTYVSSWSQVSGPVPVEILNANSHTANFVTPSTAGTYVFQYKVVKTMPDKTQVTTVANTSVVVQPKAPPSFSVSAGDLQLADLNAIVKLNATVNAQNVTSTGNAFSFKWTQVGASPAAVQLSNADTPTPSFIPTVPGTYTFNVEMSVTNASGQVTKVNATSQVVTTTVGSIALSADAGAAKTGLINSISTLVGRLATQGSVAGATYEYSWVQTSGPERVALSNQNTTTATFFPSAPGVYSFRLDVTARLSDGSTRTASSETQIIIGGAAYSYSVSAGDAQSVKKDEPVILTGAVNAQGPSGGATYAHKWTYVDGPTVTKVFNDESLIASFIPTTQGTYEFELAVTSVVGGVTTVRTARTQVLVTAAAAAATP
jgi:hypothetical protein